MNFALFLTFFYISVTDNHFDNLQCEKRIICTLSALNKNKYIFNRKSKLRHILGESVIENWLLREVYELRMYRWFSCNLGRHK